VRSIHDQAIVLPPANPENAAMPMPFPGNASARAWYLPWSSPLSRGALAGLDRGIVPCDVLLLAHPATRAAAAIAAENRPARLPIGASKNR